MRVLFYKRVCHTHTCVNTVRTLPLNNLVILRERNAANHPWSGSDRFILPTLERVTLPARTGLGTTWISDKKVCKTTYFPTLSPLPSSHLHST